MISRKGPTSPVTIMLYILNMEKCRGPSFLFKNVIENDCLNMMRLTNFVDFYSMRDRDFTW